MDFINTLFLLIAVVGLGVVSCNWNIFDKDEKKVLSAFVFSFALPVLFVSKISKLQFNLMALNIFLCIYRVLILLIVIKDN